MINKFIYLFLLIALPIGLGTLSFPHKIPTQPMPDHNVMEEVIKPQLSRVSNSFQLQEQSTLFPQAYAAEKFDVASALLAADLDTGEILYEKNAKVRLPIASLTKIMTAVVALDLASKDESFEVSENASKIIPTRIGVKPYEKLRLSELLEGLLLTSANDTAEVIKEGIDKKYGEDIFIDAMNEKASFIGLTNTSFTNPQGFDNPNNYSTPEDLAILTHYALKNYPLIEEIVRKDYEFLPQNADHRQFDLFNWNGLIGVYPNTIGMKIGNTGKAGKTTVVVSNRANKRIIAIVLGAPDLFARDMWAARLLDIGYEKQLSLPPVKITKAQLQAKYNTWKYF